MFPVPLNSSKINSSMRLPVSINAVARMVRLPPSSTLRAEPKNFLGLISAFASTPPDMIRPLPGCKLLYPRDTVEQNHHVLFHFQQTLGALQHHLRHLHMSMDALIEVRMIKLAIDFPLQIGHFFRPLVH